MQNKEDFLGTEPIGKLLFRLSIPTVVAQLINMLYNIVDRIYIGTHSRRRKSCPHRRRRLYADYHDCIGICRTGQLRRRTEEPLFLWVKRSAHPQKRS